MTATAPRTGTVFTINPAKSAWRIVDGEAVLIHAETTYYYGLNPTGTWVWQQLLEDDLSAEMLGERAGDLEPAIDRTSVVDALADFLQQLQEEDLIESVEDGPANVDPGVRPLAGRWAAPEMTRYSTLEDLIVCGE